MIFVSTKLNPEYEKIVSDYAKVITRPNIGYDFCSYKLGIEHINNLASVDRLILFNNSFVILDPKKLAKDFFGAPKNVALRGLTLSYDIAPHIQSFWLSFETQDLIGSEIFKEWWTNVVPLATKEEVIRNYEIGMSQWFAYHHVPLKAVISSPRKSRLAPVFKGLVEGSLDYVDEVIQVYEKLPMPVSSQERLMRLKKLFNPKKVWNHLVYLNPIRPRRYFHLVREYFKVSQKNLVIFNPSHHSWHQVYRRFSILKIGLLDANPTNQNLNVFYRKASAKELALVKEALLK